VIGGLLSLGIIGLFVGPMVLAVTYRLLESWVADIDRDPGQFSEGPPPGDSEAAAALRPVTPPRGG